MRKLDDLGALRARVLGMEGGRMAPSESPLLESKHVKDLFGYAGPGRGPFARSCGRRRSDRIWLRCYERSDVRPSVECTATGRLLAKCRDLLADPLL